MHTMLWYAWSKLKLDYIKHKSLQTGHKFNEGDIIHSAIERASKHIDVYTQNSLWCCDTKCLTLKKVQGQRDAAKKPF